MERLLTRRRFVRGAAAAAGSTLVLGPSALAGTRLSRLAAASDVRFTQGVACGEPGTRAITLWTHLDGLTSSAKLDVEVALDAQFARTVVRTSAVALPDDGGSARVRLSGGGLQPSEQYWYRFESRDGSSPIGRFRTLPPADSREPIRIAFFSCQEYIAGWYHAHADLADRDDLDLVVCLGDYIYERAFADQASVSQPVRTDTTAPDGETQTLAEYRRKYALHHSDANLIAVRQRFPLAAIWDDHEVEDNYADGLPGGATTNRRVPFAERKANGYRAFFESMPRLRNAQERDRTYGSLRVGGVELFFLDSRQYRDDQPCNPSDAALSQPCAPATTDDPSRTLLGAAQKTWLKDALRRSTGRWKLIANQVMAMSLDAPPRNTLNTDAWDGYAAERAELVDHLGRYGISNVAFVTGDIHTFFAGNVTRTGRQTVRGESTSPLDGPPRATEFVTGSITSPGIVDRAASEEAARLLVAAAADALVLGNNPHMTYANQAYKGYGIVEARPDQLLVELRAVHDTRKAQSSTFSLRRFRVRSGVARVEDLGGPIPLPEAAPPGPLPTPQLPLP